MADIQHIGQLNPDQKNARRHTARNIGMIVDALHEVGAARSIVIDENYRILAGNGTIDAAAEAGIEKMLVVPVDGETIVAVQRTGLTEAQKTRLALFDNRASDTAEWDASVLAVMAEDGVKLDDLWVPDELDALLADVAQTPEPGDGGDEFDATPEDGPTTCQPGDLWALGPHRLLCGDSTKAEDVARLMAGEKARMCFTDPPWNVAIGKDSNPRHRQREGLENDDLSPVEFAAFLRGFAGHMASVVTGDVYCVLGASEWPTLDSALRDVGLHWSSTVIWVKDQFVLGRSKYHRRYEPIWYGWGNGATSSYCAGRDQDDVWEFARPRVSEEHPTMKPVGLVERAIKNSSKAGDVVFEPFCGSGTTLVASHRTGRKCLAIELAPKYCDVILKRYTAETGDEPKLLERTHGTAAETAR